MQLKACLALLPPPQHRSLPPMATVYVTEDKGVGEELSKAKWVFSNPRNYTQSSVMTLSSHSAFIHLFMCGISEQLSMPIGEEWKESVKDGRWRESISGKVCIPTFNMT